MDAAPISAAPRSRACAALREAAGNALRPGGLRTTRRGMDICRLKAGEPVLDVGCGPGASVHALVHEYRLDAVGIDPDPAMLELCAQEYGDVRAVPGSAEAIPFGDGSMAAVLCECCLHLSDIDLSFREFKRVLKPGGWLILSDVYAAAEATDYPGDPRLPRLLEEHRFRTMLLEDGVRELRELAAKIILRHGSLAAFWSTGGCDCDHCLLGRRAAKKLRYYLLVARLES